MSAMGPSGLDLNPKLQVYTLCPQGSQRLERGGLDTQSWNDIAHAQPHERTNLLGAGGLTEEVEL